MIRHVPQDPDIERGIIATLGSEGSLTPGSGDPHAHQALLMLKPGAFIVPQHRVMFEAIQAVYRRCEEVTPLTIRAELDQAGKLDFVGGFAGITDVLLADTTGRPDILARIAMDRWRARQIMLVTHKASEAAEQLVEPNEVVRRLQVALAEIQSGGTSADVRSASQIMDYINEGRPFRDQNRAEKLAWTGISTFDDALESAPGHVVIVAARPGVGKTALAVQGACTTARRGQKCLLVSLEMDHDEVMSRIAARMADTSASTFRRGTWDYTHVGSLHNQMHILDAIHVWAHPSGVAWERIEAVIRDQVQRNQVSSVWLDYFTLIRKPSGKSNDASLWGEVSSSIKRLAQELGICIVLLCQLNREGDAVEPKLSDLRETGQLEQDANAVLMLWPKDPKSMDSPTPTRVVYGKLAKNRSGQAGWRVEIQFNGAIGSMLAILRETA